MIPQLAEESGDKQEALQALCHQQTATAARPWFPEGKAEGMWAGRSSTSCDHVIIRRWASMNFLHVLEIKM